MLRRILFAILSYFLILIITITPIAIIRLNILADIIPNLELYIIYFSALYCPVSIVQIFLYGFYVDAVYGSLAGLDSALFILGYVVLLSAKAILLSRLPLSLFLGFLLFIVIFAILKYIILVKIFGYYASLLKIALQICTTIFLYPAAYFCFSKIVKIYENYVK